MGQTAGLHYLLIFHQTLRRRRPDSLGCYAAALRVTIFMYAFISFVLLISYLVCAEPGGLTQTNILC
jgi:hypothetical protein